MNIAIVVVKSSIFNRFEYLELSRIWFYDDWKIFNALYIWV